MRNALIICLLLLGMSGCKDNDTQGTFDASIPQENIRFDPMYGGAVMHYTLPSNTNIDGIKVTYLDVNGKEVTVRASYLIDSLTLVGFNEARTGVPVQITLLDKFGNESEPMSMKFNTLSSIPVQFFDNLHISPSWGGIVMDYEIPTPASGFAHVFYIGQSTMTHKEDTVHLKTVVLSGGRGEVYMELVQPRDEYTIIIRTEDFRGYNAKEEVFHDVQFYPLNKLEPTEFDFLDPSGLSQENAKQFLGKTYLFDGDKIGTQRFLGDLQNEAYTFIAGPNAVGKSFIIDLRESITPAYLRLYAMLKFKNFPILLNHVYFNKLPSEMTVYGSDNKDDGSWVRISHYKDEPDSFGKGSWADASVPAKEPTNYDVLKVLNPCFVTLDFGLSNAKYRYLKLEINNVFKNASGDQNPSGYVTFNELEVYVSK